MIIWMIDLRPKKIKTNSINKLKPDNVSTKKKKTKQYVSKKKELKKKKKKRKTSKNLKNTIQPKPKMKKAMKI